MPSLSNKHPTASRWVLAAGLLLIASLMSMMTTPATAQNVVLEDGAVFEGNMFNSNNYDTSYLLTSRTVSSYVQFISCTLEGEIYDSTPIANPPDTLVTSQYMKWVNTLHEKYGIGVVLAPNSYTHSIGSRSPKYIDFEYHHIFYFDEISHENVTIHIEDANIDFAPFYPVFSMVTGSHTVVHVSGLKVQKKGTKYMKDYLFHHSSVATAVGSEVKPPEITGESVFYFENCECVGCSQAIIYFQHDVHIDDNSALIFRGITNRNPEGSQPFFSCGGSIFVEEMGVFSLIDIDTANNDFKASSIPLFQIKSIVGEGVVMLARVSMQKSGLTTLQPVNNDNFYVSARASRSDGADMTTTQLLEEKFNVNDANTMNWDGTDVNGNCVQAGLAVPGRATYTKVDGNCAATCTNGNVPPACTAQYVNPCLPNNCDICYRKTRTKCLVCQPHTTHVSPSEQCECKSPNCAICPSEGVCSECIPDYKLNEDGACVRCVIPHCNQCSADNICADCADGYKASGDKTKCFKCKISNCQQCSEDDKCEIFCDPDNPGKDCYQCNVKNCKECETDGTCLTCDAGTELSEDGQCYQCTVENCNSCTSDGVCGKCADGYKPTNNDKDCVHCTMSHCSECSDNDVCASCDAPYKPSLEDGQCYQCTVEKCNSCTSDGVCGQCDDEYKLSSRNKQCYHCTMPHCTECNADDMCMQCAEGYKPSADRKSCLQCTESSCALCGANNDCQLCDDDHTLTKKGECISCDLPGCQRCDLGGVCALCDGEQETVTADGTDCVSCSIGNCTYCSDDGKCAMCACGMVPTNDGSACVACDVANCVHCDLPGDGHTCAECASGYALSDDGDICERVSMPPWGVFLIVAFITVGIVVAAYVAMLLYLRHQAKQWERVTDAVERSRYREDSYYNHLDKIFVLDIGDVEGAADGERGFKKDFNPEQVSGILKKECTY